MQDARTNHRNVLQQFMATISTISSIAKFINKRFDRVAIVAPDGLLTCKILIRELDLPSSTQCSMLSVI